MNPNFDDVIETVSPMTSTKTILGRPRYVGRDKIAVLKEEKSLILVGTNPARRDFLTDYLNQICRRRESAAVICVQPPHSETIQEFEAEGYIVRTINFDDPSRSASWNFTNEISDTSAPEFEKKVKTIINTILFNTGDSGNLPYLETEKSILSSLLTNGKRVSFPSICRELAQREHHIQDDDSIKEAVRRMQDMFRDVLTPEMDQILSGDDIRLSDALVNPCLYTVQVSPQRPTSNAIAMLLATMLREEVEKNRNVHMNFVFEDYSSCGRLLDPAWFFEQKNANSFIAADSIVDVLYQFGKSGNSKKILESFDCLISVGVPGVDSMRRPEYARDRSVMQFLESVFGKGIMAYRTFFFFGSDAVLLWYKNRGQVVLSPYQTKQKSAESM